MALCGDAAAAEQERDTAAAELLQKALSANVPVKEMRLLVKSLPSRVVQFVLHGNVALASAPENHVVNLKNMKPNSSDAAAAEHLEDALNSNASTKEMRTLIHSLPVHIVQSVFAKFALAADVPVSATSVTENVAAFESDEEEDAKMESSMSVDAARVALLKKASDVNLPRMTMHLLKQSLRSSIVENEVSNSRQLIAGQASARNYHVSESKEILDAKEFFSLALAADLPLNVARLIVKALPPRLVQQELASRGATPRAPPASKL